MNMSLAAVLKTMYFWSAKLTLKQIRHEVGLGNHAAGELCSFLR
jgi:hypothetical protein